MAADEYNEYEVDQEFEDEMEDEFESDELEMEMAEAILELESEEELDQFLGDLVRKVASVGGRVWNSNAVKGFRDVTRPFVRAALPTLGAAAGGFLGSKIPGSWGAKLGTKLGRSAGSWLGDRYEFETGDEMEMEVAKGVVKVLKSTAKQLGSNPRALHSPGGIQRTLKQNVDRLLSGKGQRRNQWNNRPVRISGTKSGMWYLQPDGSILVTGI